MGSRRPVHQDGDRDDEDLRRVDKGYTWESNAIRSWDQIVEDPTTGRLKSFDRQEQIARKRIRDDGLRGVRRGIIRYSVLVIDTSSAMDATDLKPSRIDAVCAACGEFVREYFDQNPISQLAVVTTRDAIAKKLSNISSNANQHIGAIEEALRLGPYGDGSLQNALDLAHSMLAPIPSYGTREIIIAYGALSTCDPKNIHDSIAALAPAKIRCSAVGLGAELHILRAIADRSGGTYQVALNEDHFAELLGGHVIPPPTTAARAPASLIRMGFPVLKRIETAQPFWDNTNVKRRVGYECPRCAAWLSEMPCECILCGLTLVSSPHLARSYHHLFPVPKFAPLSNAGIEFDDEANGKSGNARNSRAGDNDLDGDLMNVDEVAPANGNGNSKQQPKINVRCTGCLKQLPLTASLRLLCPLCNNIFCIDCDAFVHDALHHCPSCGMQEGKSNLADA
jgi:transcription initiation factor TFIIH subunit 2